MTKTWIDNATVIETGGTDAFNSRQVLNRRKFIHNDARGIRHLAARGRLLRVLIVDDDRDTSDGLVMLVRLWGHTAQLAYGGKDALRAIAAQQPDIVLLDIEMPSVDGCQVARRMRLGYPSSDRLIIAITGRVDDARRRQCSEAGIDLVLLKPVDPLVLETLLMLECELTNHLDTGGIAAAVASRFASPVSIGL